MVRNTPVQLDCLCHRKCPCAVNAHRNYSNILLYPMQHMKHLLDISRISLTHRTVPLTKSEITEIRHCNTCAITKKPQHQNSNHSPCTPPLEHCQSSCTREVKPIPLAGPVSTHSRISLRYMQYRHDTRADGASQRILSRSIHRRLNYQRL